MIRINYVLAIVLMLLPLVSVQAFQSYKVVGEGTLRWFWFDLYEARLLSPSGQPDQTLAPQDNWPLALELTYLRKIKKDELIKTTREEWQRMQLEYVPGWLEALDDFWPSVNKGDVLLLHVNTEGQSDFYYNDAYIGGIADKRFSRAFLSIWLSEQSRDPSLRKHLLGIGSG